MQQTFWDNNELKYVQKKDLFQKLTKLYFSVVTIRAGF